MTSDGKSGIPLFRLKACRLDENNLISTNKPLPALRDYHDRIVKYGEQLEYQILATKGNPINACDWFYWFGFDIMGDLALGRSFDMLTNASWHGAIATMREGMDMLGVFTPVPWLCRLGFSIPGAATGWKRMVSWCEQRMKERLEVC